MFVYRIVNSKHSSELSDLGASLYGGRWNSKGKPVIYTGENVEIALLEVLANITIPLLHNYNLVKIAIPDNSIDVLNSKDLPKNCKHYPAPKNITKMGDEWIKSNNSVALKVPSCIILTANNYILNCNHPDIKKVKIISIAPFKIDSRLV